MCKIYVGNLHEHWGKKQLIASKLLRNKGKGKKETKTSSLTTFKIQ